MSPLLFVTYPGWVGAVRVCAPATPANAASAAAIATALRRRADGGLNRLVIVAVLSESALQKVPWPRERGNGQSIKASATNVPRPDYRRVPTNAAMRA